MSVESGGFVRRWGPWLVMLGLLMAALVYGSGGHGGPATVAQRVQHIAGEVRCPTCQDLSAANSDAAAAKAVRAEIERRVEAGQSDGEIKAYLAGRYGGDILLRPPARGIGSLVWVLPVVALVLAVAGLAIAFVRWRGRTLDGERATAEDRALVERELGR